MKESLQPRVEDQLVSTFLGISFYLPLKFKWTNWNPDVTNIMQLSQDFDSKGFDVFSQIIKEILECHLKLPIMKLHPSPTTRSMVYNLAKPIQLFDSNSYQQSWALKLMIACQLTIIVWSLLLKEVRNLQWVVEDQMPKFWMTVILMGLILLLWICLKSRF